MVDASVADESEVGAIDDAVEGIEEEVKCRAAGDLDEEEEKEQDRPHRC